MGAADCCFDFEITVLISPSFQFSFHFHRRCTCARHFNAKNVRFSRADKRYQKIELITRKHVLFNARLLSIPNASAVCTCTCVFVSLLPVAAYQSISSIIYLVSYPVFWQFTSALALRLTSFTLFVVLTLSSFTLRANRFSFFCRFFTSLCLQLPFGANYFCCF